MMKRLVRCAALAAILFLLSGLTLNAQRPRLKNTKWVCVEKMFVADAGTMTDSTILEFGAGKDVVLRSSWFLPAHSAMYVNPDGSIDRIEATSSGHSAAGTWTYRRRKLTVTLEDGSVNEYLYRRGTLVEARPSDIAKVFRKE